MLTHGFSAFKVFLENLRVFENHGINTLQYAWCFLRIKYQSPYGRHHHDRLNDIPRNRELFRRSNFVVCKFQHVRRIVLHSSVLLPSLFWRNPDRCVGKYFLLASINARCNQYSRSNFLEMSDINWCAHSRQLCLKGSSSLELPTRASATARFAFHTHFCDISKRT